MKILLTFVFGLFIFALLTCSSVTAQSLENSASDPLTDQIIVKYKDGQSSEDLISAIQHKEKINGEGILSALKIFFNQIGQKISGQETAEYKLYRIVEAEQRAGILAKQELFKDDAGLANFYQMKLSSPSRLETAISIFRNLPEVEFAEANWLSTAFEYK